MGLGRRGEVWTCLPCMSPVAAQPVASGLTTAPGPSEILELTGGEAGVEAGVWAP